MWPGLAKAAEAGLVKNAPPNVSPRSCALYNGIEHMTAGTRSKAGDATLRSMSSRVSGAKSKGNERKGGEIFGVGAHAKACGEVRDKEDENISGDGGFAGRLRGAV